MAAAHADPGRLSVLVADSQALFAQALGAALARQPGVEVLQPYPRSGVDAAQAGVILRPDVAILDLWLEGITGTAAARTILAKSRGTRVLMLGWLHGAEDIEHALDAGAAGFVSKQLGLAAVLDAIARLVAGDGVVADPNYGVAGNPASRRAGEPDGNGGHGRNGAAATAFTPRELEVLRLLGAGLPVEDVAARLDITPKTAQTHLSRILGKTGAHSQLQAVAVARERGYLV